MPTLALPAAAALHFLVALPTTALPHDIRLGDDVYFWRTAALLALETLAQHKLQPGLQRDAAGNLSARWLPVLDGPRDGPRLARLVAAMPPLCRAAPGGDPPSARDLLDSFLTFLVDGAMRDWCGELGAKIRRPSGDRFRRTCLARRPAWPRRPCARFRRPGAAPRYQLWRLAAQPACRRRQELSHHPAPRRAATMARFSRRWRRHSGMDAALPAPGTRRSQPADRRAGTLAAERARGCAG